MQIGRKIYYDSAGNVIVGIGSRQGDVVDTTIGQDFADFAALQPYQQSAVGVLQIPYGQDEDNFLKYPYHVDVTKTPPVIVWDTTATDLANAQTQKSPQLQSMFMQTLAGGFNSSATGTSYLYGFADMDQTNLGQELNMVNAGLATEPIDWAIKSGQVVSHTIAQFKQVCADGNRFKWNQVGQLRTLLGQAQSATTVDAVNAIQWTPATY